MAKAKKAPASGVRCTGWLGSFNVCSKQAIAIAVVSKFPGIGILFSDRTTRFLAKIGGVIATRPSYLI